MKPLIKQRNSDFIALCNRLIYESAPEPRFPTVDTIIRRAVRHEAPRYYVDIDNAVEILNNLVKNGCKTGENATPRMRMWFEILRRVNNLGGIKGNRIRRPILAYVLKNCKASSFFISQTYGRALYFSLSHNDPRPSRAVIRHRLKQQ